MISNTGAVIGVYCQIQFSVRLCDRAIASWIIEFTGSVFTCGTWSHLHLEDVSRFLYSKVACPCFPIPFLAWPVLSTSVFDLLRCPSNTLTPRLNSHHKPVPVAPQDRSATQKPRLLAGCAPAFKTSWEKQQRKEEVKEEKGKGGRKGGREDGRTVEEEKEEEEWGKGRKIG